MADQDFNINVQEEAADYKGSYGIIEPGWKKVVITQSCFKATVAGNGEFYEVKNELQDGTGRSIINRFNTTNPTQKTQDIARKELAAVANFCGIKGNLSKADLKAGKLHGRPYEVRIEVGSFISKKEGDIDPETGKQRVIPKNEIKEYRACQSVQSKSSSEAKSPTGW